MLKSCRLKKRFILHVMPIKGLSEQSIENKETSALIACSSRPVRLRRALFSNHFCALSFADVSEPDLHNAMQEGHAALIRDYFLGLSDNIADLYICCDSGESRSPAIAAAILTVSGLSDDCIWRNPFFVPNTLVYKKVCCAFGIPQPETVVVEKKQLNQQAYRNAQHHQDTLGFCRWPIIDMKKL